MILKDLHRFVLLGNYRDQNRINTLANCGIRIEFIKDSKAVSTISQKLPNRPPYFLLIKWSFQPICLMFAMGTQTVPFQGSPLFQLLGVQLAKIWVLGNNKIFWNSMENVVRLFDTFNLAWVTLFVGMFHQLEFGCFRSKVKVRPLWQGVLFAGLFGQYE